MDGLRRGVPIYRKSPFTKEIRTNFACLSEEGFLCLTRLSDAAIKVLFNIMHDMHRYEIGDSIPICLNSMNQEKIKISKSSYTKAMSELTERNVIQASTTQGLFWVNPNLFSTTRS